MWIDSDDPVYAAASESPWLGPPGATFPWRARYFTYWVGAALFIALFAVVRLWAPLTFFTVAYCLLGAVALTRRIGKKVTTDRPPSAVATMSVREMQAPRRSERTRGGAASIGRVRVRATRPRLIASPSSPTHDLNTTNEVTHA